MGGIAREPAGVERRGVEHELLASRGRGRQRHRVRCGRGDIARRLEPAKERHDNHGGDEEPNVSRRGTVRTFSPGFPRARRARATHDEVVAPSRVRRRSFDQSRALMFSQSVSIWRQRASLGHPDPRNSHFIRLRPARDESTYIPTTIEIHVTLSDGRRTLASTRRRSYLLRLLSSSFDGGHAAAKKFAERASRPPMTSRPPDDGHRRRCPRDKNEWHLSYASGR